MKNWDVLFRFAFLNIWIVGILIEKFVMQKYMFFASTFVFVGYFIIDFIRDMNLLKKTKKKGTRYVRKTKKR